MGVDERITRERHHFPKDYQLIICALFLVAFLQIDNNLSCFIFLDHLCFSVPEHSFIDKSKIYLMVHSQHLELHKVSGQGLMCDDQDYVQRTVWPEKGGERRI